jgi:Outer membrane protein beta-barrel domain
MTMTKVKLLLATLLALISIGVSANPFYGGGNIGLTKLTNCDKDCTGTGFNALLGYRITNYLSTEVSYANLGNFNGGSANSRGIALVTYYPVIGDLSAMGRIGANKTEFKRDGITTDSNEYSLGIGATYPIGPGLSLRAQWEYFLINKQYSSRPLTVGAVWSF